MESVDCIVVGAGVVGLAVARALALAGREALLLDAAEGIGTETSSRNSEVIHAGIYYPAGSLMARFCVAGRRALYAYCAEKGVPHANCGKLIVATSAQEDAMIAGIKRRAEANGVEGMRVLSAAEAIDLEPNLNCTSALLSPRPASSTAMPSCWPAGRRRECRRGARRFSAPSSAGGVVRRGLEVDVGGADPTSLRCRLLVNSAGPARAATWPRTIAGMPAGPHSARLLRQGQLLHPVRPVTVLAADLSGTGAGRARRSPDNRPRRPGAVRTRRGVDRRHRLHRRPARADGFYAAVRKYWPALKDGALQPGYAGIRPKIVPRGAPAQDFVVQGPQTHGVPGLINLFGIESPGLTASLALAEHVLEVAATG